MLCNCMNSRHHNNAMKALLIASTNQSDASFNHAKNRLHLFISANTGNRQRKHGMPVIAQHMWNPLCAIFHLSRCSVRTSNTHSGKISTYAATTTYKILLASKNCTHMLHVCQISGMLIYHSTECLLRLSSGVGGIHSSSNSLIQWVSVLKPISNRL